MEDHHAGDIVVFDGERTERSDTTPVLIQLGNLTTP